jgi:hypothetical protein
LSHWACLSRDDRGDARDGLLHTVLVIFEPADGLIVQTGAETTIRLATTDIVSRFASNRSLMPDGLLKDLKPLEVADLYGYLRTLRSREKIIWSISLLTRSYGVIPFSMKSAWC